MELHKKVILSDYNENGWCIVRDIIPYCELILFKNDYNRIINGTYECQRWGEKEKCKEIEKKGLYQLKKPSDVTECKYWKTSVLHMKALEYAKKLTGRQDIQFSYDQIFFKDSYSNTIVEWHQDAAYWGLCPAITCWVALSKVTKENGGLIFMNKSHNTIYPHQFCLDPHNGTQDVEIYNKVLLKDNQLKDQDTFSNAELYPGDCTFHSHLTLHKSGPNKIDIPRYGYAIHFQCPKEITDKYPYYKILDTRKNEEINVKDELKR